MSVKKDKAAREKKKAEDKAAREKKKSEEKAAREKKKSEEKAAREKKKVEDKAAKKKNIVNKGTGAGGKNTNKNGISYETLTDLSDKLTIHDKNKSPMITFGVNKTVFQRTKQSELFKCMNEHIDCNIKKAHGCKKPDECYIDHKSKNIFFIEKKFQQREGSVCEKIQTGHFKKWQYERTFPDYNIIYIYCLSDWFKINCEAEIEYLEFEKTPYFWGDSLTYKDDIIKFIINYK